MTLVVRLIEIIEKWIRLKLKCVAVWLISSVYGRRKHTHLPPELQTLPLELLSTFLQALSQLQSAFVKNGSHPERPPARIVAHGSNPPTEPGGLNGKDVSVVPPNGAWATTAPYFCLEKLKAKFDQVVKLKINSNLDFYSARIGSLLW